MQLFAFNFFIILTIPMQVSRQMPRARAWLVNLRTPEIIAGEIVENLESALEQFGEIQGSLKLKQ
jgi:hypothetical protein